MKKFGILAFLAMLAMNAVTAEAVKGGPQSAEIKRIRPGQMRLLNVSRRQRIN